MADRVTLKKIETDLGDTFRDTVNDNFTTIANALNLLIGVDDSKDNSKTVTKQDITNLQNRIDRIVLGVDQATIEAVVTEILQQKGVIN
ncbi:hypothetical protein [Paucilactobacillus sp. N302-9]